MKRILLIGLMIVGCGADPDDFQPQESDGCRSDDIECQESVQTDAVSVITERDYNAEAEATWTDSDKASLIDGCIPEAQSTLDARGISRSSAFSENYCVCMEEYISGRYTADEFLDDPTKVSQETLDVGAVEGCFAVADTKEGVSDTGDVAIKVDVGVTVDVNVTTRESSALRKCETDKLCRGMTKEEVLDVVGEPDTISEKILNPSITVWEWREEGDFNTLCQERYSFLADKCSLEFKTARVGARDVEILVRANDFLAERLDVLNY